MSKKMTKEKQDDEYFTELAAAVHGAKFISIRNKVTAIFEHSRNKNLSADEQRVFFEKAFSHPKTNSLIWNKSISDNEEIFIYLVKCVIKFGKDERAQALETISLTEDLHHVMPVQTALLTSPRATKSICKAARKVKNKNEREELIKTLKEKKNSDDLSALDMQESWNNKAGKVFIKVK